MEARNDLKAQPQINHWQALQDGISVFLSCVCEKIQICYKYIFEGHLVDLAKS